MRDYLEKDYKDASISTISDDFLEGTLDLQRVFGKSTGEQNSFDVVKACRKVRRFYESGFNVQSAPTGYDKTEGRFVLDTTGEGNKENFVYLNYGDYVSYGLAITPLTMSNNDIRSLASAFYKERSF